MSLNDGQLDDIEPGSPVDNDIIKPPNSNSENIEDKDKVIIIPKTDEIREEVTQLDEAEKANLPNLEVTFNNVSDRAVKITELKDVESEILGDGRISQEDASYIHEIYGDLFNGSIKINEFTKTRSLTNLSYVKKFMSNRISQEQISFINMFEDLVADINKAYSYLLPIKQNGIDTLSSKLYKLKYKLDNIGELDKSKNNIINYNNDFVKLSDLKITDFKAELIKIDNAVLPIDEMNELISRLITNLQKDSVKYFLICCKNNLEITTGNKIQEVIHEYHETDFTIGCLYSIFSNPNTEKYIDILKNKINEITSKINSIMTDLNTIKENKNDSEYINYTTINSKLFNETIFMINFIIDIYKNMNYIANDFDKLTDYL